MKNKYLLMLMTVLVMAVSFSSCCWGRYQERGYHHGEHHRY